MDLFLTKEAFPGPCMDAKASSATFVGQARFNGCIAFCNWPRRDVEALLPKELELAANASSSAAVHPVAFIFGEQTLGATIFAGITLPLGVHYHEFALAIPFVKHRHGRYLHTFIPRMYSSYFPAVWHGNTYYGLAKEMATMWWQGPVFLATASSDALLLHAAVEGSGSWSPGATASCPTSRPCEPSSHCRWSVVRPTEPMSVAISAGTLARRWCGRPTHACPSMRCWSTASVRVVATMCRVGRSKCEACSGDSAGRPRVDFEQLPTRSRITCAPAHIRSSPQPPRR